ncbi:YfcE family phosphodiesterase [Anaerobacillus alkalidiazotrophicus]|uniref:Phosphoesterase n=1 Tax=Anaerobacillus alkalidiazotrophicus TaxID=472963 RepID=A0A1S2M7T4_9BACI|nr:phosphodiesterase [Anaerobacillus alkalidiazotrophicus]OIJ20779.1 YfcE family phosphodiesterase [Anaerobacillus alkalidiazotrophicus]
MKLGFISDTHGGYENVVQALKLLNDSDQICHLGDVLYHGPRNDIPQTYNPKKLTELLKGRTDIMYVRGNCDADVDEAVLEQDLSYKSRVITFDNYRFYLVHGYEETEEERIQKAKEFGCQVVVSGHTHVKVLKEQDGIIVLNPGSTTIPKDGTKSFAFYENGQIEIWDLDRQSLIVTLKL